MGRWPLLALLFLVTPVAAETWHVDDDAAGAPDRDGSVAHPFDTIQEAIDASSNGDTVLVADGTYTGDGNRDLDFGGRAIVVRSENGPAVTVIDCGGSSKSFHRGFIFQGGEGPDAVVAGLTITNGFIGEPPLRGGGVFITGGSNPTFVDCVITGNRVDRSEDTSGHGGGVSSFGAGADPTLIRCVITDNTVRIWDSTNPYSPTGSATGGGVSGGGTLVDCLVQDNFARGGSSASSGGVSGAVSMTRCDVVGNEARSSLVSDQGYGGFARAGGGSLSGTLVDCTFIENTAASTFADVGGVSMRDGSLFRCVFRDNRVIGGGFLEGLSLGDRVVVMDCRFEEHADAVRGGQSFVNCQFNDNCVALATGGAVVNCTFTGNRQGLQGLEGVTVSNSIFWNNPFGELIDVPAVHHCIVEGGYAGVGNVDADPLLALSGGLFRPGPGSPAIDAGDNGALPPDAEADLAGGLRFVDDPATADTGIGPPPIVDIGAVEYQLPCPDTNGDGVIDVNDLEAVFLAWGTTDAAADVNGDGIVDGDDLGSVIAGWGVCP